LLFSGDEFNIYKLINISKALTNCKLNPNVIANGILYSYALCFKNKSLVDDIQKEAKKISKKLSQEITSSLYDHDLSELMSVIAKIEALVIYDNLQDMNSDEDMTIDKKLNYIYKLAFDEKRLTNFPIKKVKSEAKKKPNKEKMLENAEKIIIQKTKQILVSDINQFIRSKAHSK